MPNVCWQYRVSVCARGCVCVSIFWLNQRQSRKKNCVQKFSSSVGCTAQWPSPASRIRPSRRMRETVQKVVLLRDSLGSSKIFPTVRSRVQRNCVRVCGCVCVQNQQQQQQQKQEVLTSTPSDRPSVRPYSQFAEERRARSSTKSATGQLWYAVCVDAML